MEIKLLSLEKKSNCQWDNLVSASLGGTIFHRTAWLNSSGKEYEIWGFFKNDDLLGGFVAPYRKILIFKRISAPLFTPYSGIVYKNFDGKYVTKISKEKEFSIKIASFLKKKYPWGVVSFHPSIVDVQAFVWNGFKIDVRYTYLLDIADISMTWNNLHESRKREIRTAQRDGFNVIPSYNFNELADLIALSFKRNGLIFNHKLAKTHYEELTEKKLCKGFICLDKAGHRLAAIFVIWDEKRAYYLLGGYDKHWGKHNGSSLCMWESIKFASEKLGLKEYDFEGSMIKNIESYFRSFGGKITPYYEVSWGAGNELIAGTWMRISKYLRI